MERDVSLRTIELGLHAVFGKLGLGAELVRHMVECASTAIASFATSTDMLSSGVHQLRANHTAGTTGTRQLSGLKRGIGPSSGCRLSR
jgi:hypothetical protein